MKEPVPLPPSDEPAPRATPRPVPHAAVYGAVLGVVAAAPLGWYLRGFTVDDALIPARYAHHLARGLGYRFNAAGPVTDGVTPLGFAHLLSPFARDGVLAAWTASRWIGRALHLAAVAALGGSVGALSATGERARPPLRYAALLLLLFSAPLAAWASAGLETAWVVALATFAAVLPARPAYALPGAALAGACAWLRPEMLAFALVMAWGRATTARAVRGRWTCVLLGVGPWLLVAAARALIFGRPAPLAVWAKPSDLAHGLRYVVPAVLFAGAPLVALAPGSWRPLERWPRTLVLAGVAHLAVVALAGGDWMPLARLVCPVLPAFVLVSAHLLAIERSRVWAAARLGVACAAQIAVLVLRGDAAHRVAGDRLALIAAARPELARAETVATLDVGWVGAATDATIVDLAGATDPGIAALPGGHTSKAISGAFLSARRPDILLFATERLGPSYTRIAEQRLAADPLIARHYRPVWRSPDGLGVTYIALQRERDVAPR